ncbi:MAG: hypothetical protein AAB885_04020 [Patescibacteria group bacterium]
MNIGWRAILCSVLLGTLIGVSSALFFLESAFGNKISADKSSSLQKNNVPKTQSGQKNVPVNPALEVPIFNVETDEDARAILEALLEMPPETVRSIPLILVRTDSEHFESEKDVAHTHSDGWICLLSQYFGIETKPTVWHEATHARLIELGDKFLEKCAEASGGTEAYRQYSNNQRFPHNGFLWRRSTISCHENYAFLAEAIYRETVLNDKTLTAVLKKADARTKELNLENVRMLLEGKIVSMEMFNKIEPLFK